METTSTSNDISNDTSSTRNSKTHRRAHSQHNPTLSGVDTVSSRNAGTPITTANTPREGKSSGSSSRLKELRARRSSFNTTADLPPSMVQMEPKPPILKNTESTNNLYNNNNGNAAEYALTDEEDTGDRPNTTYSAAALRREALKNNNYSSTSIKSGGSSFSRLRRKSSANEFSTSNGNNGVTPTITTTNATPTTSEESQIGTGSEKPAFSRSNSFASSLYSRKSTASSNVATEYSTPIASPDLLELNSHAQLAAEAGGDYFGLAATSSLSNAAAGNSSTLEESDGNHHHQHLHSQHQHTHHHHHHRHLHRRQSSTSVSSLNEFDSNGSTADTTVGNTRHGATLKDQYPTTAGRANSTSSLVDNVDYIGGNNNNTSANDSFVNVNQIGPNGNELYMGGVPGSGDATDGTGASGLNVDSAGIGATVATSSMAAGSNVGPEGGISGRMDSYPVNDTMNAGNNNMLVDVVTGEFPAVANAVVNEITGKKKKVYKPINIDETIQRLLDAGYAAKRTKNVCLKNSEITQICHKARSIFLSQPSLLELSPPVKIVGDVHGQYGDLLRLFTKCGFPPASNFLFLGDYVDRGKQSLETILLLLCYKIKYPENFFLLRGNHECANVTRVYGFYDECKRRCNVKIWKIFIDTFNTLPLAAIVAGKIFCVHGGLSPVLNSMDEIRHVSRPTDVPDFGLINDLLWSDPTDSPNEWEDNERGVSYCYNKVAINKFLNRFGFDLVCRAHMVVEDGYEFFNERSLVTVFSAPNYCGEFDNWGAVMSVSEGLLCSFELLDPLDSAALKQVMKKGRQERKLANQLQQQLLEQQQQEQQLQQVEQ